MTPPSPRCRIRGFLLLLAGIIVFRAAHAMLVRHSVTICHSYVGNYATSLEMAGCSISLLRLNERLKHWIAAPAQSPALMLL